MALDPSLLSGLQTAQKGIVLVIRDLQKRPDYSKQPDFKTYVTRFNAYNQALLNALAQSTLSSDMREALVTQSKNDVLPDIEKLIDDNIAQSQMGQLNTNQTIPASLALEQNKTLSAEQADIQSLNALLSVDDTTDTKPEQPNTQPSSNEGSPEPQTRPDDTTETPPPRPYAPEIIPETEVIARFSEWARSLGGEDTDAA
ncbi:hypothetical protein [Thalassospira lucentensis]|uniref:hypothetical protein n=1 Tax=Thalassospira lucentensis TaxID=168935 RepID=UPI0003B3B3B8|nr:hypothetical protein [Thalassospira lucentensis]RCK21171.1 hypothetical protein TH1_18805 [Thalassospira lucentensis MCCC 1A00383 = DSM 14000]